MTNTQHSDDLPDKVTLRVENTPSGNLLRRAMEIMRETNCTMGEAMDAARAEAQ